jgi:hypothetical protein
MSNKKGFVRYANNKLVAGSLILADKAPKVGTWKEVDYDLCCGNSQSCSNTISTSFTLQGTETEVSVVLFLILQCNDQDTGVSFTGWGAPTGATTIQEFINLLNGSVSPDLATFSWGGGTTVNAQINSCFKNTICPDGELTISFPIIPD